MDNWGCMATSMATGSNTMGMGPPPLTAAAAAAAAATTTPQKPPRPVTTSSSASTGNKTTTQHVTPSSVLGGMMSDDGGASSGGGSPEMHPLTQPPSASVGGGDRGESNDRRSSKYSGAVSRRGGRIAEGGTRGGFVRNRPAPAPAAPADTSNNGRRNAAPGSSKQRLTKDYDPHGVGEHVQQQITTCNSNLGCDVPSLASSSGSTCSQTSPARSGGAQQHYGGKGLFMTFSPEQEAPRRSTPPQTTQPLDGPTVRKAPSRDAEVTRQGGEQHQRDHQGNGGHGGGVNAPLSVDTSSTSAHRGGASAGGSMFDPEGSLLVGEKPPANKGNNDVGLSSGLSCRDRVSSPPPTQTVCFAEGSKGGNKNGSNNKHGGGRQHQPDLKLNSPCMFSPFGSSHLNVLDSPSFRGGSGLTPIPGKSILRSPKPSSAAAVNGSHTPTNLFHTPRGVNSSFDTPGDTPDPFEWLQSPSHGFIGRGTDPANFPNTPVSSFLNEVGGRGVDGALPWTTTKGGGSSSGIGGGSSSRGDTSSTPYSQICISPLAPSRQRNRDSSSGGGGRDWSIMRSPKSPGRYKFAGQGGKAPHSSTSSSGGGYALEKDMAERDLMEDEDLSVLLQLASSTSNGNVFSSPVARQHFQRASSSLSQNESAKIGLQLPMIHSSSSSDARSVGGSPRLARKPSASLSIGRSMEDAPPPPPRSSSSTRKASKKKSSSSKKSKSKKSPPRGGARGGGGDESLILQNPDGPLHQHPPPLTHSSSTMSHGYDGQPMMGGPPPITSHGQHQHQHHHAHQTQYQQQHHGHHPHSQMVHHPGAQYAQMQQSGGYAASMQQAPYQPIAKRPGSTSSHHPATQAVAQTPSPAPKAKRARTASPKKKRGGGQSRSNASSKITSPPIDGAARNAAERQAVANSHTPNANAAALAAAILRGVTMRPSGKWQAQLYYAGKSRYIGVFDTREKAALAYEIAREKLKADPKDTVNQTPEATEAKVNLARKAAFAGVNEPDPRKKK